MTAASLSRSYHVEMLLGTLQPLTLLTSPAMSFLDFPPEIRNMIYFYLAPDSIKVMGSDTGSVIYHWQHDEKQKLEHLGNSEDPKSIGLRHACSCLLRASRIISSEMRTLLDSITTVYLDLHSGDASARALRWLEGQSDSSMLRIQRLRILVGYGRCQTKKHDWDKNPLLGLPVSCTLVSISIDVRNRQAIVAKKYQQREVQIMTFGLCGTFVHEIIGGTKIYEVLRNMMHVVAQYKLGSFNGCKRHLIRVIVLYVMEMKDVLVRV